MKKDIKKFFDDLYKLDPSLKNQEKLLIELVDQMLASRPEVRLDQQFVSELRQQLDIQAEKNKAVRIHPVKSMTQGWGDKFEADKFDRVNKFNFMKKFTYALGGAVICAILFVSVYYPINQNKNKINLDLGEVKISQLSEGSFGAISLQSQDGVQNQELGRGAGGGGIATVSAPDKIGIPAPSNYTYVYSGDEFVLDQSQGLVYKYQLPQDSSKQLANLFKNTDFGLVDINKFSNLGVQSLTLAEDRQFGHIVSIDLERGALFIMENWVKWQQDDAKLRCGGDVRCLEQEMLKIEDVPSDKDMIAIADRFLDQYGVNTQNYGQPEVMDEWRVFYERSQTGLNIPEIMQVVYPLIVDGQRVYEAGGQPAGLNVNVNIRYNKVSGVYGLRAENYQSASYNLEQDKEKILEQVKQGGIYPYWYGQGDKTEVELDTPEFGLIKVYNFKDNAQEEMLVPGLVFNLKDRPDDYYGKQKVVVLLVEGIVDTNPMIEPRPVQ